MTINKNRLFNWNQHEPNSNGAYVLYWTQIQRRLEYNFALEHAVEWANKLGRPLVIFEGLRCDYPWASDRFHSFVLQGMAEMDRDCEEQGWNYYPYLERAPAEGRGLIQALSQSACLVVTDHFPTFVIQKHNEYLGPKHQVPYVSVDSGCVIPLGLTRKAPYSAYEYRRFMQRYFLEAYSDGPKRKPLNALKNRAPVNLSAIHRKWPRLSFEKIDKVVASLPIDHQVPAVGIEGTRRAALQHLKDFVRNALPEYAELRNHPDLNKTSHLSPYLHFGKISSHEVVSAAFSQQPEGWSTERIHFNNGTREGFFRGDPSVEAFLDQVITWREVGYHHCQHVPDHDKYESLPEWARRTLEKHASDKREFLYTAQEFEDAATHDPLWNAAQNELRREGRIHNYLRMLWGKKILEWSTDPRAALQVMIHLNNKYAVDGRNPNSYTGIFWTMGRFDRPWAPERPIFGSVRYMSSANTARKVRLKQYLLKYS